MSVNFKLAVGKTHNGMCGTSVVSHSLAAAFVAIYLYEKFKDRFSFLPYDYPFVVGIHDIGKLSAVFQYKISPENFRKCDTISDFNEVKTRVETNSICHENVGAEVYRMIIGAKRQQCQNDYTYCSIKGHHGLLNGRNDTAFNWMKKNGICVHLTNGYEAEYRNFIEYIRSIVEPYYIYGGTNQCDISLMTGFVCVCDWIASNEEYFPSDIVNYSIDDLMKRADYAVDDIFYKHAIKPDLSFLNIFNFEPFEIQQKFIDMVTKNGRGIYILEGPMGIGKTEAAEMCAYKLNEMKINHGWFFGAPTRLTSNKIHDRFEEFYTKIINDSIGVKLSHGQSWMKNDKSYKITQQINNDDAKNDNMSFWYNPSKRALVYDYVVGTVDQALMNVLRVKHSCVRNLGLANKVVILDEVHSYDEYTFELIKKSVEKMLNVGCTVIILSATLTAKQREELLGYDDGKRIQYPIISGRTVDGKFVSVDDCIVTQNNKTIDINMSTRDKIVENVVTDALNGMNVLVIENTVNDSIDFYNELKNYMIVNGYDMSDFPIGLLHSRFTTNERNKIEDKWIECLGKNSKNRPHGSVLVSTQIVEQSVDIDVDRLYTRLAPVDCILQRIGREWRHNRKNRPIDKPITTIFVDSFLDISDKTTVDDVKHSFGSGNVGVYSAYKLLRTYEVISNITKINLPSQITQLIENCFGNRDEKCNIFIESYREYENTKNEKIRIALNSTDNKDGTVQDNEENVSTRYSEYEQTPFLVVKSCSLISDTLMEIVTLDGKVLRINSTHKDKNIHIDLIMNQVNCPSYVRNNDVIRNNGFQHTKRYLKQYFYEEIPIIFTKPIDIDDQLYYNNVMINYGYNEQLGFYTI